MTTWAEKAQHDPGLRAFVDARIAQAHVRLQSIEIELKHAHDVIVDQQRQIQELKERLPKEKGKR